MWLCPLAFVARLLPSNTLWLLDFISNTHCSAQIPHVYRPDLWKNMLLVLQGDNGFIHSTDLSLISSFHHIDRLGPVVMFRFLLLSIPWLAPRAPCSYPLVCHVRQSLTILPFIRVFIGANSFPRTHTLFPAQTNNTGSRRMTANVSSYWSHHASVVSYPVSPHSSRYILYSCYHKLLLLQCDLLCPAWRLLLQS